MLHIILLVLKIILTLLAVILGVALLLILLVLFVPLRYRIYAKKGESLCAQVKIGWLGPVLSVPVSFADGNLDARLKICGITVRKLLEKKIGEPEEEEAADAEEETAVSVEIGTAADAPEEPEQPDPAEAEAAEEAEEESIPFPQRILQFLRAVGAVLRSIPEKFKNLKCTIQTFCGKIKEIIRKIQELGAFAADARTKAALSLALRQIGFLLGKLLPRKIAGEVHFGMEDPALTGEILGGVSVLYPVFVDKVKLEPDFEQAILEGELSMRGRLRLFTLLQIAWRLFWDRNVRFVYRRLKQML